MSLSLDEKRSEYLKKVEEEKANETVERMKEAFEKRRPDLDYRKAEEHLQSTTHMLSQGDFSEVIAREEAFLKVMEKIISIVKNLDLR